VNRVVIIQGFGFHLIPEKGAIHDPFKTWTDSSADAGFQLISYGKDGKLLISDNPTPPPLPKGWTYFQPLKNVGEWEATVGWWKWKLVHERADGWLVFVGIVI
jgi:hypothetical protein